MSKEKAYMNSWMVPKNKRKLTSAIDTLFLFISANENSVWKGDRDLQRSFEKMLEKAEVKSEGEPYDPNSGGARTYEAQLACLGLIFFDNKTKPQAYRPTLAGQAILDGADPLPILQRQILKFQYPSAYSMRTNVSINPGFSLRPFLFVLRLLQDNSITYLTKEEIGKIVIVYGRKDSSFNAVKKMILEHRKIGDKALPKTFLEDSISPRTKDHSLSERIDYLEDKANIFFNYLESVQLIIRPDSLDRIEINPEAVPIVEVFENEKLPMINHPDDQYRFQRIFGLPPWSKKDTRKFVGVQVTDLTIKERMVMRQFFTTASTTLIVDVGKEVFEEISSSTGVHIKEVASILEKKRPDGLSYFEEKYLDMAAKGTEEAIDFEKATAQIFRVAFGYNAKHIGQIRPKGRKGGNPDVIVISEEEKYCGIIDSKAYLRYSITNDHKNRMLNDYIPNYKEHVDNEEELRFFMYVSGGFSNTFNNQLKDLVSKAKINGSGITARNLLHLAKKQKEKPLPHKKLSELFSKDKELTILELPA